jgi:branched-chain amino acid transport system ATP-binding protein
MLDVLDLEAGYGKVRVLKLVSLHVGQGEIVTVIGPNGAGKTTLLKTIAGVLRAWAGEVEFDKNTIQNDPPERIVAKGCRLVPEGRHVFSALTVKQNLILGAYTTAGAWRSWRNWFGCGDSRSVRETLDQVYGLFGILRERSSQLAGTLSGGQQQMLAIGRALMSRPKLLMLDEPSLGVAPLVMSDLYKAIVDLKRSGLTILLVEQNARAALAVADRGYVLEAGRIVLHDTTQRLLDSAEVQRAYLGKEYRRTDE